MERTGEDNKIRVLWVVEGNKDYVDSIRDEASGEGLLLKPFSYWSIAKSELERNYEIWHAIILDLDAKVDEKDNGNTNKFLISVLAAFESKQWGIPCFFSSDGSKSQLNEILQPFDKFKTWDDNREKKYYSILDDRDELYKNIKKIAANSENYKILSRFSDVLDPIDDKHKSVLIDIIKEIEYKNNKTNDLLFNEMRKILESNVIPRMIKIGIFKNYSGEKSLNKLSAYFGNSKNPRGPVYICRALHSITQITNDGSHLWEETEMAKLVKSGKAPYVLKSCLYELLNIIYWLNQEERMNLRT